MKNALNQIYSQREEFIVLGLVGRTGSGCSTAANILSKDVDSLSVMEPCLEGRPSNEDRKKRIICKFASKHWKPFFFIRVRDIITSFILDCTHDEMDYFMKENGIARGIEPLMDEYKNYFDKNKCLDIIKTDSINTLDDVQLESYLDEVCDYIISRLPIFTERLKKLVDSYNANSFIAIYQKIGDNIRKHGIAIQKDDVNVEHIYEIAKFIDSIISALRKMSKNLRDKYKLPRDYFVIDAFRNPFEALYFKEKYSAFYLIAINAPDDDRVNRLGEGLDLSPSIINKLDDKEYPKNSPLSDYSSFISQNISACIQFADIHVHNSGNYRNRDFNLLKYQLVKFVCLIQHPGLVTPSREEKLMQVAYTAKLNSGCLSRQVGAVVTNSDMAIKAIGWNSSPDDQVPCLLRNIDMLLSNNDQEAYSHYEHTNIEFRKVAYAYKEKLPNEEIIDGLNASYCFKDLQNDMDGKKNQVHNRALHAEENAFLQIAKYGGEGVIDGYLFTTASPCESCSRKAYQIGISCIVYIDPYPGIAIDHSIRSGSRNLEVRLFSGAIGRAYHQLYTPIVQIKDELEALIDKKASPAGLENLINGGG